MYNNLTTGDPQDKRFLGIYRGVVVDSNDPNNQGRIRMLVPQILGEAVTGWAYPITGAIQSNQYPYGTFTNTVLDTITSTTVAYTITYENTEDSGGGVYLDSTHTSRVYVSKSGDYLINFCPQFFSTNASSESADVWLRKNGVDVPRTNSRITLQGNPNYSLHSVPFIIDLKAGDYIEVAWCASSTNIQLKPFTNLTNPTRPDIPAVITTVSFVGNFTPSPGTGCWVMFEGGDPNFPLWLGAF